MTVTTVPGLGKFFHVLVDRDRYLAPEFVDARPGSAHEILSLRGVQKPGSRTVTSALRGIVREDARTLQQFLALAAGSSVAHRG